MLVLARQKDETIMIGDDVEITIVDIRGDKVRLGINAPKSVQVHRKEVWDAIKRENRAAANLQPGDVPLVGAAGARPPLAHPELSKLRQAHEPFLRAALEEAKKGLDEGGLPIGAVLVRDGKVVAGGHNRRVQHSDPMAHAEIDCLTKAGRQKTYRDTILYSTLMPCFLCSGAVVQFGIPRVVVGESVNFRGGPDFLRAHGVEVVDLNDAACIEMMRGFIQAHPDLWHEDIGK